jgi:hypothetical protein
MRVVEMVISGKLIERYRALKAPAPGAVAEMHS